MTRKVAKNILKSLDYYFQNRFEDYGKQNHDAMMMAIKALEQENILDKIRAEIEQLTSRYTLSRERGGMGQVEWSDRLIKESDILQIIDKYRK